MEYSGLKTHYHVTRHPQFGWQNLPDETFARKLGFFSGRTIITFPFNEVHSDNDGIQALLKVLCAAKPFMQDDMLNIFSDTHNGKRINFQKFDKEYGVISANFQKTILDKQFHEDYIDLGNIYLPVFKNVTASDVIDIRKNNADLYRSLEIKLIDLLSGSFNTEDELLHILREIDRHVVNLNQKFEDIQRYKKERNVSAMLMAVPILLAIPTAAHMAILAALMQTAPLIVDATIKILKKNAQIDLQTRNMKIDDYYLLWRIDDPKKHK